MKTYQQRDRNRALSKVVAGGAAVGTAALVAFDPELRQHFLSKAILGIAGTARAVESFLPHDAFNAVSRGITKHAIEQDLSTTVLDNFVRSSAFTIRYSSSLQERREIFAESLKKSGWSNSLVKEMTDYTNSHLDILHNTSDIMEVMKHPRYRKTINTAMYQLGHSESQIVDALATARRLAAYTPKTSPSDKSFAHLNDMFISRLMSGYTNKTFEQSFSYKLLNTLLNSKLPNYSPTARLAKEQISSRGSRFVGSKYGGDLLYKLGVPSRGIQPGHYNSSTLYSGVNYVSLNEMVGKDFIEKIGKAIKDNQPHKNTPKEFIDKIFNSLEATLKKPLTNTQKQAVNIATSMHLSGIEKWESAMQELHTGVISIPGKSTDSRYVNIDSIRNLFNAGRNFLYTHFRSPLGKGEFQKDLSGVLGAGSNQASLYDYFKLLASPKLNYNDELENVLLKGFKKGKNGKVIIQDRDLVHSFLKKVSNLDKSQADIKSYFTTYLDGDDSTKEAIEQYLGKGHTNAIENKPVFLADITGIKGDVQKESEKLYKHLEGMRGKVNYGDDITKFFKDFFNQDKTLKKDILFIGNTITGKNDEGDIFKLPLGINDFSVRDSRFGFMEDYSRVMGSNNKIDINNPNRSKFRDWVGDSPLGKVMDSLGLGYQSKQSRLLEKGSWLFRELSPNSNLYEGDPYIAYKRIKQGKYTEEDVRTVIEGLRRTTSMPIGVHANDIFTNDVLHMSRIFPSSPIERLIRGNFEIGEISEATRDLFNAQFGDASGSYYKVASDVKSRHLKNYARLFGRDPAGTYLRGKSSPEPEGVLNVESLLGKKTPVFGETELKGLYWEEALYQVLSKPQNRDTKLKTIIGNIRKSNITDAQKNEAIAHIYSVLSDVELNSTLGFKQGDFSEQVAKLMSSSPEVDQTLKKKFGLGKQTSDFLEAEKGMSFYALPRYSGLPEEFGGLATYKKLNEVPNILYKLGFNANNYLTSLGLGLPDEDLKTTVSLYSNLFLKRAAPAYGAYLSWKIANNLIEKTPVLSPRQAIRNIKGKAALGVSAVGDVTGINYIYKGVSDYVPGLKSIYNPISYSERLEEQTGVANDRLRLERSKKTYLKAQVLGIGGRPSVGFNRRGIRYLASTNPIKASIIGAVAGSMVGRTQLGKAIGAKTGAVIGAAISILGAPIASHYKFSEYKRREEIFEYYDTLNYIKNIKLANESKSEEEEKYFRLRAEATLTHAAMGDKVLPLMKALSALPTQEKDILNRVIKQGTPSEKAQTYKYLSDIKKRVFGPYLGVPPQHVPEKKSLEEYFTHHPIPPINWKGWDEDFNLKDAEAYTSRKEKTNNLLLGLSNSYVRDSYKKVSSVPVPVVNQKSYDIEKSLHALLEQHGIMNPNISLSLVPSNSHGSNISIDIEQDHTDTIHGYFK